ncbi:cytochrome P450 [Mycena galopus ATCC 62051]|nr:cytochrome P450 [Mycena galopus ATCC 62051]
MTSQITVLCVSVLCVAILWGITSRRRSKLPLPPGPRRLPLVGNLFDVPATFQWETFARWAQECNSDIIYLSLAGKPVIVLSSLEATDALLEKRSSMYSDRPRLPMVAELMGWDFNIATMKYGEEWRTHRRLFNQGFNVTAARKYQPHELTVAHTLLGRLLTDPDAFSAHIRQMAGELIMSAVYGIDVLPTNDPWITLANKAVHAFSIAFVPGLYLVDTFPVLKYIPSWFPGAKFKRQAQEWRILARGMRDLPFSETKRQMESGIAPPSFTADSLSALEEPERVFYQEHHIKATSGTTFLAGTDTTVSSLGTFILAMLAYPEVQKKAQAEIDSITGGQALPTFEDENSLPYISALVKEVLRWRSVTPFAVPHLLGTEDEFRGYRLPAGSLIIGNAWAILHDETVYPDAYAFKPERFLLNGRLNPAVKDPDSAFGFGRRQCPGRHMAISSIWITVASILATFNIEKALDVDGNIIEPSYEYLSGLISAPLPFKCSIKPRSPEAVGTIQAAANDARRPDISS